MLSSETVQITGNHKLFTVQVVPDHSVTLKQLSDLPNPFVWNGPTYVRNGYVSLLIPYTHNTETFQPKQNCFFVSETKPLLQEVLER